MVHNYTPKIYTVKVHIKKCCVKLELMITILWLKFLTPK